MYGKQSYTIRDLIIYDHVALVHKQPLQHHPPLVAASSFFSTSSITTITMTSNTLKKVKSKAKDLVKKVADAVKHKSE